MNRLGEKIAKNCDRQNKEFYNSSAWLNRNEIFDHDLRLTKEYRDICMEVFSTLYKNQTAKKQKQKLIDIEILIANLIASKRKPISVSLRKNEYKKTRYRRTSYYMPELIKLMEEHNFINSETGFNDRKDPSKSRRTRIWAADRLLEMCKDLPVTMISSPPETVILKDWDKTILLDYKETPKTIKIRQVLTKANDVNLSANIFFKKYRVSPILTAVFIKNFSYYGRLHTKGYKHAQSFSKNERLAMQINGEPVVELDFSALHPHILYANEKIQFDGDPYRKISSHEQLRPILKIALLRMINCRNTVEAKYSIKKTISKDFPEIYDNLSAFGIKSIYDLVLDILKKHKPIAKYLCKGKKTGLKLMNKDAEMAIEIVSHFVNRGIPIIPIHDSFIIQSKYAEELREEMDKTFKKYNGGFKCPIK